MSLKWFIKLKISIEPGTARLPPSQKSYYMSMIKSAVRSSIDVLLNCMFSYDIPKSLLKRPAEAAKPSSGTSDTVFPKLLSPISTLELY